MNLLIVESPNKVKKISSILGPGWAVEASVGHIRDLPKRRMGIGANYALEYDFLEPYKRADGSMSSGSQVIVERLARRVASAQAVYLATDPDREGEAIAWHLATTLGLRSYWRVKFHEITSSAILEALSKPQQIDMNLFRAQEARRAVDRLVGFKVSPVLRQQTGLNLSAGRVQTVALRMVVERQAEIGAFGVTNHYGAEASFEDGAWRAEWDASAFLASTGQKYNLNEGLASDAASCREFTVTESTTRIKKNAPPPPFITATLLQAASVSLGFSPDKTAALAQSLFGQGLITYHRTDSENFSAEALTEIRHHALRMKLPIPAASRTWKANGAAQEAHEAIRPTLIGDRAAGSTDDERKLYALIWTRAIASQLADAEYRVNTLSLQAQNGTEAFQFRAVGRTLIAPGWRSLTASDATEDEDVTSEPNEHGLVPSLPPGSRIRAADGRILKKQTKPPSRYTAASLIKKLEAEGIGRPSTYASIIGTLMKRAFINEAKRLLYATETGVFLIDALRTNAFAFVEYDYTRTLEQALDDIAAGQTTYLTVVSALDKILDTQLSHLTLKEQPGLASAVEAGTGPLCPRCGTGRIAQVPRQMFYSCSNHSQGCRFTIQTAIGGKKLTLRQIEMLCTKGITGKIKGFKSTKKQSTFDAALHCNAATGWGLRFHFDTR